MPAAIRPSTLLFLATVAVSASFAIVATRRGDRQGVYLFKPLTTLIILIGAALLIRPAPPLYRALIVIGLGCSLGGDILLMLPAEPMTAGVVAFLLAQLSYLAAFSLANPVTVAQLVWLLPFAALLQARQSVLLLAVVALTTLVYPLSFGSLVSIDPAAVLVLNLRNILLLGYFAWTVWPAQAPAPWPDVAPDSERGYVREPAK